MCPDASSRNQGSNCARADLSIACCQATLVDGLDEWFGDLEPTNQRETDFEPIRSFIVQPERKGALSLSKSDKTPKGAERHIICSWDCPGLGYNHPAYDLLASLFLVKVGGPVICLAPLLPHPPQ